MRPIPASRFQLMPQPGSAVAIIRSALRYAASAIPGIPSTPGVFTTRVGGGADAAASAMWKPIFGCSTATTSGPVGSVEARATAATGVMAASRSVHFVQGKGGAPAPSTLEKIRQAMIATPNAGDFPVRFKVCWTVVVAERAAAATASYPSTARSYAYRIRKVSAARNIALPTDDAALTTGPGTLRALGTRRIAFCVFARAEREPMRPRTRTRPA